MLQTAECSSQVNHLKIYASPSSPRQSAHMPHLADMCQHSAGMTTMVTIGVNR